MVSEKLLSCDHPESLMVVAVRTGERLFCELCDCREQLRDALTMEHRYKEKLAEAEAARDAALRERDAHGDLQRYWGWACGHNAVAVCGECRDVLAAHIETLREALRRIHGVLDQANSLLGSGCDPLDYIVEAWQVSGAALAAIPTSGFVEKVR